MSCFENWFIRELFYRPFCGCYSKGTVCTWRSRNFFLAATEFCHECLLMSSPENDGKFYKDFMCVFQVFQSKS